ncbi:unnamed protein product [Aphanomyces euteiches]
MTCTTTEASLEVASNEERVALTPADDIKKERKTRFAYKEADDVKLLQEILSDDGLFIDGTKDVLQWHGIHKRLQSGGMDVSIVSSVASKQSTTHSVWPSAHPKELQVQLHHS